MEGFVASSASPCELHMRENWPQQPLSNELEEAEHLITPIMARFSGCTKTTLGHLITVHNETCGCHTGSTSHEAINMIWNQKKVLFIEVQKQFGLEDFDDFLNRGLRLLLTTPMRDIPPLSESEFWKMLRPIYPEATKVINNSIDEDLADINNFIAKDIGGEPNQVFMNQSEATEANHYLNPDSVMSTSAVGLTASPPNSNSSFSPNTSSTSSTMLYNEDELMRMKRKEKHMAPIDCTGLPPAFNLTWRCKPCDVQHASRDDCEFYRNYHHPRHFILNNASNILELPNELELRHDGVYSGKHGIKAFTRLGPLKGQARNESDMDFDEDKSNVWLIYTDNGERKCLKTSDKSVSNWISQVTPADSSATSNVLAVSSNDLLYLVTGPEGIPPHTKIKYFAKEDPTTEFWTSWTNAWANQKRCSRCSIHGQFDSVADYRVHISLWHDVSFHGNPQNRIYYCPDCGLKKIGAKEIVEHCRQNHDSLPFLCRHCSKRFETYNSLIKHKNRIHAEDKPLRKSCDFCGKQYLDPKALKQHVKQVHEKSKQLHCVQCEFIFSSKYALNRHVREVHEKQQEFVCSQCNKQFTQQSNLKQHMLIHSRAKPFSCRHEGCKAAFTTKQCLQVHYRKVHHYRDDNMPRIPGIKLDEFIATVVNSDDSSTHSGEYFNSGMGLQPNLPPSTTAATFDHLLPDVS